jgi:hypothetical protein
VEYKNEWYGGPVAKIWPPAPKIKWTDWNMTAIAVIPTRYGFIIAADGRSRWAGEPTADEITKLRETDTQQKIFEITDRQRVFGYAMTGSFYNKDGSLNLVTEAHRQREALAEMDFESAQEYALRFAEGLTKAIKEAKKDRKLTRYPENRELNGSVRNLIVRVVFAGYLNGNPHLISADIFHDNQVLREPKIEEYHSKDMFIGSEIISKMIFEGKDPRFSKYRKPIHRIISLQGASEAAKAYIEACCDPIGVEIDPLCKTIGGYIHIAEITPNGFRWRIPPIA